MGAETRGKRGDLPRTRASFLLGTAVDAFDSTLPAPTTCAWLSIGGASRITTDLSRSAGIASLGRAADWRSAADYRGKILKVTGRGVRARSRGRRSVFVRVGGVSAEDVGSDGRTCRGTCSSDCSTLFGEVRLAGVERLWVGRVVCVVCVGVSVAGRRVRGRVSRHGGLADDLSGSGPRGHGGGGCARRDGSSVVEEGEDALGGSSIFPRPRRGKDSG